MKRFEFQNARAKTTIIRLLTSIFFCVLTGPYISSLGIAQANDIPQTILVTKTAVTSMDEYYGWTIDKYASLSSIDLAVGETGYVDYYIHVAPTGGTYYENFKVQGEISIYNTTTDNVVITNISDTVSNGITATVDSASFPFEISPQNTKTLSYYTYLPDNTNRLNTVTVTSGGFDYGASAIVDFANAITTLGDNSITVYDLLFDNGALGTVDEETLWHFTYEIAPYDTQGTYSIINTAFALGFDSGNRISDSWELTVNVVPEPSTFILLCSGLIGLAFAVRKKKKE